MRAADAHSPALYNSQEQKIALLRGQLRNVSRAIANIQKMEIELRKELKSITGVELLGQPEPDIRGGGGLRGSKQGLLEGPARRAKKSGTHCCRALHVSGACVRCVRCRLC